MQLTFEHQAAREAGELGMRRALEHAEAEHVGWGQLALMFLAHYAQQHKRFTSYELRKAARDWGLVMPPTDKAFGPIFQRAAREGVIHGNGYVAHPERHASPTVLWESLVYGRAT